MLWFYSIPLYDAHSWVEKPGETANDALNKGKEQAASAADSAKATLDKALGKGENNNAWKGRH